DAEPPSPFGPTGFPARDLWRAATRASCDEEAHQRENRSYSDWKKAWTHPGKSANLIVQAFPDRTDTEQRHQRAAVVVLTESL
ncbi:hypothetical protein QMO17_34325, partial [Klebsiella pneumoniae]|nr:hypothetical protein [Klebsiella pneumoniae]